MAHDSTQAVVRGRSNVSSLYSRDRFHWVDLNLRANMFNFCPRAAAHISSAYSFSFVFLNFILRIYIFAFYTVPPYSLVVRIRI